MTVSQNKNETVGAGGMVTSPEQRRFLAQRSHVFECEECGYKAKDFLHLFDFDKEGAIEQHTGNKDEVEELKQPVDLVKEEKVLEEPETNQVFYK